MVLDAKIQGPRMEVAEQRIHRSLNREVEKRKWQIWKVQYKGRFEIFMPNWGRWQL